MLDWLFIILLIFAIILVIMSIEYAEHSDYWGIVPCIMSIPIWLSLSFGVIELHRPYELFNVTSGFIETGVHNYTVEGDIFLSYLFMGVAAIMIIYLVYLVFDAVNLLEKLGLK